MPRIVGRDTSARPAPLPPSADPWPPGPPIVKGVDHVLMPGWAPFVSGLVVALMMSLITAGILSRAEVLGLSFNTISGQGPDTSKATVEAYLHAIADGDAQTALSYLDTPPPESLLLTKPVLDLARAAAPVREISVDAPKPGSVGTERVSATYLVGADRVTASYVTVRSGGTWRLRDEPGRLNVSALRSAGVRLYVAGVEVPAEADSLAAFPGTYALTTSNPYLGLSPPASVTVHSPGEALVVGSLTPIVTPAGFARAEEAVRRAVQECLDGTTTVPLGCPGLPADFVQGTIVDASIRRTEDPAAATRLTPLPNARRSTVTYDYQATWTVTADVVTNRTRHTVSTSQSVAMSWIVDLTTTPLTAQRR